MLKTDDLFENHMQPIIRRQVVDAGNAAESLDRDFVAANAATANMISRTVAMQKLIAGGALLLGALVAWLVGRGIIRPVSGMTAAMGKLAAGETAVEVPSRDATDEMGAMATAVEVFKQNAIERARLQAERKQQEEQAAREKHVALVGMAEKIEAETGAALEFGGRPHGCDGGNRRGDEHLGGPHRRIGRGCGGMPRRRLWPTRKPWRAPRNNSRPRSARSAGR